MQTREPHIVVLGGGFGGLTFCQNFFGPARITLVDRTNHHLFQPLLYQVATAGLAATEVAQPIRSILSKRQRVTVLMKRVDRIELAEQRVVCEEGDLRYDYLVIAVGGRTSYFGHPEWAAHAPGLKTLDDALRIRRDILLAFERAETAESEADRSRLLTVAIVGGGPTGVELAGALVELTRHILVRDFKRCDPENAKIILIEAGSRLLDAYPERLSENARATLERRGVEVLLNSRVEDITQECVAIKGRAIPAANILWAAGISGSPVLQTLDAPLDRTGRVKVEGDLTIPGHPNVFVIGDAATFIDPRTDKPVPWVSPAAMQQGGFVAKLLTSELGHPDPAPKRPRFQYHDHGSMATIGRNAAVAAIGGWQFTGFPAWLAWLLVHLVFLVGFRNKVFVMLQWAYSYVIYKRGARIVVGAEPPTPAPPPRQSA